MAESAGESYQLVENLKRASVSSTGSTKSNTSLSDRTSMSCIGSRRSNPSHPEEGALTEHKGELPASYIQSKFNRKGSVQYRNAGWKSSAKKLERNDSASSVKSNTSDTEVVLRSKICPHPQEQLIKKSSSEQQAYLYQKFIAISDILKNSGVDEDILQKIKCQ